MILKFSWRKLLPPLLFFEGQRTRLNTVLCHFKRMTVIMVILCAVAATVFNHWLVGISLPLSFILAAISTPTDATASAAVSNGRVLPNPENKYLALESLFNDASGIILLNMGILWYVNGYVNVAQTGEDFLYSAGGGALVGLLSGLVLIGLRQAMFRSRVNFLNNTFNSGTPMKVLYLMTPFAVYLVGEHLGVSGIIAVVCAGLLHNVEAERSQLINPVVYYDSVRLNVLIEEVLNTAVFVILGMVLVRTIADKTIVIHSWRWLVAGLMLYVASGLVRYWYARLAMHRPKLCSLAFSLGGVHGAVTFALAFTVAQTRVNRPDFNLVLMVECVLIVLSLLVPTIVFRLILKPTTTDTELEGEVTKVRQAMVNQAIARIKQIYLPEDLRRRVLYDLNAQIANTTTRQFIQEVRQVVAKPALPIEQRQLLEEAYRLAF
ncbi:cation:proton antiporter, partial [Limosilactobacillus fermentum]|uniref:cation:proton antiporter n=1 Tax=Limosilactobacillus fermentum TaxID=1613 RepID=UPI0036F46782